MFKDDLVQSDAEMCPIYSNSYDSVFIAAEQSGLMTQDDTAGCV